MIDKYPREYQDMVRKNKRRHNKQRSNRGGGLTGNAIQVSCNYFAVRTLTSGVDAINCSPSTFVESATIADVFELYRVVRLRYRLHRHTALNGSAAAVYLPGVVDNAPTTASDVSVSPHAAVITPIQTVPSAWKSVSRRDLSSYETWYKTVAGSPDPAQELQGKVYLAGNTSDAFTVQIMITFQFKNPCTTSATPAERGALECAQERERLLRILAAPPTSTRMTSKGV